MTSPTRPIRLVVSDVDGTLVQHDHSLAPSTIMVVARLRAAGVKLALVSSRPAHGLDVLLQPLGIDTPRAGFNGGEILAPDDTLLREHVIAPETSRQVVAAMETAGVAAWVFSDGRWLLRDPDGPYVQREFSSIGLPWQVVTDFSPHLTRVRKIMGVSPDFALMGRLEATLQARVGQNATALRSQSYYLDVTNPQANKGTAALALSDLHGIDPREMLCLGDMPNDTPMFAVAGFSVAMGNAPDLVKLRASAVTADNNSDGWALAIERHVLGQSAGA